MVVAELTVREIGARSSFRLSFRQYLCNKWASAEVGENKQVKFTTRLKTNAMALALLIRP
jgi:hypothetical protein